ncbi:cytochrome P450 2F2 isoform X2 [Chanos chanos]|uniref:Cytochrome P450 2F2 isoform X2 n=1 Tax=Chanos chanos TaxID=29144 RepID=A0A6J2WLJ8_CHACN|nr:cytochrome P450 2F2-like isoform X2 [Chanos chanos]
MQVECSPICVCAHINTQKSVPPNFSHTMLGTLVLLWLGIFLFLLFITMRRPKNFPPGPTPLPLFGNLLQFNPNAPLKELDKLSQRYGSVFSIFVGGRPWVILSGQEVIREALVTRAAEFTGRPDQLMVSHILDNNGVIMSAGSKWREHRRFALTTLRNFGLGKHSMEERILEEVKHICEHLERHAGMSMDPQNLFHNAASNIICSIIFGSRFNYEDDYFQTLIDRMQEFNKIVISPWAMIYDIIPPVRCLPLPFRKAFEHYEKLRAHILKVVAEHKNSWVVGKPRDMIDYYLDEMLKVTDQKKLFVHSKMVALLFDLFLAGTDTTSNTLRTLSLYLMTHEQIQERCQQEIDMVLGSREHVSYEDRHAMPYVQAVIHEAQRVSDVVPLSVFHTTTANTQIRGYSIPKGTLIVPYLSSALREKGQWKFPDEFNPQNFLNDKGEFVKPDAFMPFSAGPRVCLGEGLARMELFLILVTILRRFRLVWPEDGGVPDHSLIFGGTQSVKPYCLGVQLRL